MQVWPHTADSDFPPRFSQFWYVGYHSLVFLDFYLSGLQEEEFAPPSPFPAGEIDADETIPTEPYTKADVRDYAAIMKEKCRTALTELTEERATAPVIYPWSRGLPMSYLERQIYNLRHLQEHASHLCLVLGQNGVTGEKIDWVGRVDAD